MCIFAIMKNASLYLSLIIIISSVTLFGCHSNKEADKVYQDAVSNFRIYRDSTAYYLAQYRALPVRNNSHEWTLQANDYYSRLLFDSAAVYYGMAATASTKDKDRFDLLLRAANMSELMDYHAQADSLLAVAQTVIGKGDKGLHARLLGTKGIVASRRAKYKEATTLLEKAVDQLATDSLQDSYVFYLNYLGSFHYRQGHFGRATGYFLRSYHLAKQQNILYLVPSQYQYITKLYRKIKRYEEAAQWLDKYEEWTEVHDLPIERWRVEDSRGILYAEQGDYQQALLHFEQSKVIADSLGRPHKQGIAVSNLANLYKKMKQYHEAMRCYDEAYRCYMAPPVAYDKVVKTLWRQADMALILGQNKLAEDYLKRSVQYTDSISDVSVKVQSIRRLAVYYGKQGKHALSNKLWMQYTKESAKWNKEQETSKLQKVLVQYEAKRKALQILHLEHDLTVKNWALGLLTVILCTLLVLLYMVWLLHKKQLQHNKELVRQQEEIEKKDEKISSQIKHSASSDLNDTKAQISKRLVELMEEEAYRDPELSLKSLAQMLGTNTSYLSEVINKEFDSNYKQFIANVRITWCKHQLASNPQYVVKQLAMDAGFASPSTFYNSFKSLTKMTPKEYIKAFADEHAAD